VLSQKEARPSTFPVVQTNEKVERKLRFRDCASSNWASKAERPFHELSGSQTSILMTGVGIIADQPPAPRSDGIDRGHGRSAGRKFVEQADNGLPVGIGDIDAGKAQQSVDKSAALAPATSIS
jgi:hypothetical protein